MSGQEYTSIRSLFFGCPVKAMGLNIPLEIAVISHGKRPSRRTTLALLKSSLILLTLSLVKHSYGPEANTKSTEAALERALTISRVCLVNDCMPEIITLAPLSPSSSLTAAGIRDKNPPSSVRELSFKNFS